MDDPAVVVAFPRTVVPDGRVESAVVAEETLHDPSET